MKLDPTLQVLTAALLWAFFLPSGLHAQETGALSPEEAAKRVGQTVTLEGKIVGAFSSNKSGENHLHFGDAYPRHTLSVRFDAGKFPELDGLRTSAFIGRRVRITGEVEAHKPVPTIRITSRDAITLLPVDEAILQKEDLDGPAEQRLYAQAWRQKLQRKDFAALEKAAAELEAKKTVDGTGSRLLVYFSHGLVPEDAAPPADWEKHGALLQEWLKLYPDSITAHVAMADFWNQYAYRTSVLRGSNSDPNDPSDPTTAELALYKEAARAALAPIRARPVKNALYYLVLSTRVDEDDNLESPQKTFEEATAYDPTFRHFYYRYALHLCRHGEAGEWEAFALAHVDPKNKDDLVRYAWLVLIMDLETYAGFDSIFVKSKADWKLVKQGFEEMRKRLPHSKWILNSYVRLAGEANDPATARALLPELEKNIDMTVWCSWSNYQFFIDWTKAPGGPIWF